VTGGGGSGSVRSDWQPVVGGLVERGASGIRLLGSRCATCGSAAFPAVDICRNPTCSESMILPATFGGPGRLWGRTVLRYPPPQPALKDDPYVPLVVGLVDLDDGLRLFTRLVEHDGPILVGQAVVMTDLALGADSDGVVRWGWAFGGAEVVGDER